MANSKFTIAVVATRKYVWDHFQRNSASNDYVSYVRIYNLAKVRGHLFDAVIHLEPYHNDLSDELYEYCKVRMRRMGAKVNAG